MVEKMRFTKTRASNGYELRWYEPCVMAQVTVTGSSEQAAMVGFGPLVNYIGGNNATGTKIAMTSPVLQDTEARNTHVVSFVLPHSLDLTSIPIPRDARVHVTEVPARVMAAVTYRGRWTMAKFDEVKQALLRALERDGISVTGSPLWARYDPPWTPSFLRTNEVLVPVDVKHVID